MASADLEKQLECSVCLSIYTDPVMLRCGHNFCRDCIARVLDTQKDSGGYSCPECRDEFRDRPALHRNITLRNIVENFVSPQPQHKESGIFCAYCIHASVPAVKSCLMCEASLCDSHLKVHSKSAEHVLCDPTTSLENRKCSVHKEVLKYYCTEDSACICVSCSLVGEHRGHQVEILNQASEMKKKKMKNVAQKLLAESEETEIKIRSLMERKDKAQRKADDETERVTATFRDIRGKLEDLEKRVLSDISEQIEWVSFSMDNLIERLEIKMDKLSRKMEDIGALCNMTDPLTVLQQSDTGDLSDTEDGDDERHDGFFHDGEDLDVAYISRTLHTGLCDILSAVNVPETQLYPHTRKKKKAPLKIWFTPHQHQGQRSHRQAGLSNIGATKKTSGVSQFTQILLDVSSAGNDLSISDDRKSASWSSDQNRQPAPGRFECDQVLSSRSFSSGHHYWEVDAGGSQWWRVGMCYPSISRRGKQAVIGNNKKSWSLEKWGSNQYFVIHDSNKVRVPSNDSGKGTPGEQSPIRFRENSWDFESWWNDPRSGKNDDFCSPNSESVDDWFGDFRAGARYPNTDRRKDQSPFGYKKKSWGVEARGGNRYSARCDRKQQPLSGRVSSNKVRIDLDYEAGRISFYDLCDPIRLLHTFTATFTEPLHAALYVGEGCIKISESSTPSLPPSLSPFMQPCF